MAHDGFLTYSSNKMLEYSDYLKPPDGESVDGSLSQEDYMNRIDQLEKPTERLMTLAKSVYTGGANPTHEAKWIKHLAIAGFFGGFVTGALLKSQGVHAEYIRKHNASVFETNYLGNRHFFDTLIAGILPRGLSYGIKTCLFTTSATMVVCGSITYRSKLYWPDWLVGLTTIGAISRLWLGPRAMLVGGLCGSVASVLGIGAAKLIELSSGRSVTQLRLMNHQDWLVHRELRQRSLQNLSQETYYEKVGDDSLRLDIEG